MNATVPGEMDDVVAVLQILSTLPFDSAEGGAYP